MVINFNVKRCGNRDCDEEVLVMPHSESDDYFQVNDRTGEGMKRREIYCSARCVARAMAQKDGVERVNVYDE